MLTRIIVAVSVLCLVLPVAGFAQGFNQGDKEVLLNANGTSENDFDSTIFSFAGEIGYFFTPNIQGALRQGIQFTSVEGAGSSTNASTRAAADFNLDLGRFWPFAGANIGYIYGEDTSDSWVFGLEGGLKLFVNNTTFLLGRLEYQWLITNSGGRGFSDGLWVYTIGIGFRW